MKQLFTILVLSLILTLTSDQAQTRFIQYGDNPVLQGTPEMWDSLIIKRGDVLYEEGQYFMHYIGSDESPLAGMDIGYAYSTDCISWEKDSLNPRFLYNRYGWEQSGFHDLAVVKIEEEWHMWYGTWPLDYPNEYSYGLGYASSTDGKSWEKHGEQLNFGLSETGWDSDFITMADVIFNGEKYLMYYFGSISGDSFIFEIGVAESEDGINWTKDTLNNPVIASQGRSSHKNSLWAMDVLFDENNASAPYQMWFTGWKSPGNTHGRQRVFYATSNDGKHWVEYEEPIFIVPYENWVMSHIEALEVVCVDSIYHMWVYGSNRNIYGHGVGYYVDSSNVTGVAYGNFLAVDSSYLDPSNDTLFLNAEIMNPKGHSTSVYTIINGEETNYRDSIELYDDGLHNDGNVFDNIYCEKKYYSNLEEDFYTVKLYTEDLDESITTSYSGLGYFTTAGPVVWKDYVITQQNDSTFSMKITLQNNSSKFTVRELSAILSTSDSNITDIHPTHNPQLYPDIEPGQSVQCNGNWGYVFYAKNNPQNVEFALIIYSNKRPYWRDALIVDLVADLEHEILNLPNKYKLSQNFPNPFNPTTNIKYSIPSQSYVSLKVFDVLGREVATLVSKEQPVGNYEVEFDASTLTSGIYFYRIQARDFVETKKMVLMK
jgi:predicted GH43/DUF377 family glycosyl hydrolase